MLFLKITQNTKKINSTRKEYDSFLAEKNMSYTSIITLQKISRIIPRFNRKRAPLCTSHTMKASITVEAALAVPIFFFALLSIIYLLEIISIQMSVRSGMYETMKNLMCEVGTSVYITSGEIQEEIIQGIGVERLENSLIIDGSMGIDSSESHISLSTGIIELTVSYKVQLPIPQFGEFGLTFAESIMGKGWIGYVEGVSEIEEDTVYITDNQSVYHVDYNCSYLQLSIYSVTSGELDALTNSYGECYTPCSICGASESGGNQTIYVTENGDHYHNSLSCSGLTRTIYAVSLSDVVGKGVCSRCGE